MSYLKKYPSNPHPVIPNATHRRIPAGKHTVSVVHFTDADSWEIALINPDGQLNTQFDVEPYYEPAEVEFAIDDWVRQFSSSVPSIHVVT